MFKRMKLSWKLALGFTLILLQITVVTVVAMYYMAQIGGSTQNLYNHPYAVNTSVLTIKADVIAIDREMKEIIKATSRDVIASHGEVINALEAEIHENFELLSERFLGDQEILDSAFEAIVNWKPLRDEIIRLQRVGRYVDAATMANNEGAPQVALIEAEIAAVLEWATLSASDFVETAMKDATDARRLVMIFLVVAYALAILIGYVVTRSISTPVKQLVGFTQEIALGNLGVATLEQRNQDEIGVLMGAMNGMRQNLHRMAVSITDAVRLADDSAEQMAAAAQETSASVEELASTANQFAGAVDRLSGNAHDMTDLAGKTSLLSGQGEKEIGRTVQIMSEIDTLVGNLAADISRLNQQSVQISEIVTLITGIADQTNLLALNAAIEAARAGEQGRGFAVVADEVRQLAEQSARAAGQITQVVQEIRDSASANVKQAEAGTKKVSDGVRIATSAGKVFSEIREIIAALSNEISSIAAASQELAAGAEEMGATTQEQSASVQQMANATAEVQRTTHQVRVEMEQFRL